MREVPCNHYWVMNAKEGLPNVCTGCGMQASHEDAAKLRHVWVSTKEWETMHQVVEEK